MGLAPHADDIYRVRNAATKALKNKSLLWNQSEKEDEAKKEEEQEPTTTTITTTLTITTTTTTTTTLRMVRSAGNPANISKHTVSQK